MTSEQMRRPLGNMEAALQVTRSFAPMSVAGVLRLRGAPEVERVRDALDVLQRRHPLLRARIITSRRRRLFDASPEVPPIPLEVIPRRDDAHWQDIAAQVINRSLDVETGPLLSCTYLHGPGDADGDLVFAYDHTVMDAASTGRMYDHLLGLCAGIADPGDLAPLPLPPSIDQLLPQRLTGRARLAPLGRFMRRQAADELAYRRGIQGRAALIKPDAQCRTLTRTLDVGVTNDLVGRARRRRLTMNSVMAAALVSATYQHLHAGEALPMRAIMFADLRPELHPPQSADVVGCYISMLRHTLQVGPDDDLWTVAGAFQEKVRGSLARDEHLLAAGLAKQLMGMIVATKRMRMATTAVSYAGPLAVVERYGDIEVSDVHGFISNNRLGPVATAFAKIFGGRLSWDFVFLDTDMDSSTAERIADSVRDNLAATQ